LKSLKKIIAAALILSFTYTPAVYSIDTNQNTSKQQINASESNIKVKQGSLLTLYDCIAIALNNSPEIKNARYNYDFSRRLV